MTVPISKGPTFQMTPLSPLACEAPLEAAHICGTPGCVADLGLPWALSPLTLLSVVPPPGRFAGPP